MGLTILEVCALHKLIDVKKPPSDIICQTKYLQHGRRNHLGRLGLFLKVSFIGSLFHNQRIAGFVPFSPKRIIQ